MKQMIIGKPGSGKTSVLVKRIEKVIEKNNILLLSFTKAAAKEAYDRVIAATNKKIDRWRFSTIHSFCMRILGLSIRQRMMVTDYNNIFSEIGAARITSLNHKRDSHKLIHEDNILRVNSSYESELAEEKVFQDYRKELARYKKEFYKFDFVDLLTRGLEAIRNSRITFDYLFIDEVQDNNSLQWEIVEELSKRSKNTIYAGDDDQCIYDFAGADVDKMIEVSKSCDIKVLKKSHRLPKSIKESADKVISRLTKRIPKSEVAHNGRKGKLMMLDEFTLHQSLNKLKKIPGNWFVLSRTQHLSKKAETIFKTQQPDFAKRCEFMTIHRSKGREADNVILFTELSTKVVNCSRLDKELRLLYVGMTRAKKGLWVIKHETGITIPR